MHPVDMQRSGSPRRPMGPGALAIVLFGAWWVVLAIVVDPLVGAVMAAVMLLLDP